MVADFNLLGSVGDLYCFSNTLSMLVVLGILCWIRQQFLLYVFTGYIQHSKTQYHRNGQRPIFIRPSSDGTYYGMVMSVRVSVRPSVRPTLRPSGLRPPIFRTFLLHALTYWAEICTWLCFDVLQIKFDCRHFASIFEGVMPLCELRIKVMYSFPHFSPTCFDILSSNFAYDFVSPYYRSSSSAINLR